MKKSNQDLLINYLDLWSSADIKMSSGRGRVSSDSLGIYGVKKLRAFILELAVRGKLSEDKSGWRSGKLSDLGIWAVGSGFPSVEQGVVGAEILFAKVSDMNLKGNEKYIQSANNSVSEETVKRLKINVHPPGTVIFPKIGGAIATNKRRILRKKTAIDNNCLGIIPANGIDPEWVFLQLSSMDLSKYQVGTSVPALSQGVLGEIAIFIPDPKEQVAVINKVNELMLLCDKLESKSVLLGITHENLTREFLLDLARSKNRKDFENSWTRVVDLSDTLFVSEDSINLLKSTLIQLAIEGSLTQQDSSEGTGSELLESIYHERANLLKAVKKRKISPIDITKLPKIPDSWVWTQNEYISHDWGQKIPTEPFVYIDVSSVDSERGAIDKPEWVLPENAPSRARKIVKPGSVIYSTVRPYLLNVAIIDDLFEGEPIASTAFVVVHPRASISSKYIYYYLRSPLFVKYVESVQTGIAYPAINDSQFYSAPFPLPPVAEQHRIVSVLEKLLCICEEMKVCVRNANSLQLKIADTIVDQALL